mmetsp:Transcript_35494/g.102249  ORF Transcript_35494/g.102249 Transcript_35494/m.102249 type:complete len:251 (-) Transcript_35494:991-1743(-)
MRAAFRASMKLLSCAIDCALKSRNSLISRATGSTSLSFACHNWPFSCIALSTPLTFSRHCVTKKSGTICRPRPASAAAAAAAASSGRRAGEVWTAAFSESMDARLYSRNSWRSISTARAASRKPSELRSTAAKLRSTSAMRPRMTKTSLCVSASKASKSRSGARNSSGATRTDIERRKAGESAANAPPDASHPFPEASSLRQGGSLEVVKACAFSTMTPEGRRSMPKGSISQWAAARGAAQRRSASQRSS